MTKFLGYNIHLPFGEFCISWQLCEYYTLWLLFYSKNLILNILHAFKTIITFGATAYISLHSTYRGKSSCRNFSLIAEPIADIMNEAINNNRLAILSETSEYIAYYDAPSLLLDNIPFNSALDLLFPIPTHRDAYVNLHVDDYINTYLHRITNRIHNATRCFNIITNTFNLFYKQVIENMPNRQIWSCALSIRKLCSEGSSAETKKDIELDHKLPHFKDSLTSNQRRLMAHYNYKVPHWEKS